MDKLNKISAKNWVIIWIAGLAGQICWNIENQWFNTFVYAKIAPNPSIISWMVAVSAIVTTFATFLMGTLSDRIGKRKPFMVYGYILWGIFTIVFGVTEFLPKSKLLVIAAMVVLADALMSFFGSSGNDAGFNPWTTDITNEKNRGGLGAVIAVQPVIATILGSVVSGFIIEKLDYFAFFIIMGGLVSVIGVMNLFLVKDVSTLKPNKDEKGFWHQFGSAFNFKMFKENRLLLWVFIIFALFFISFNIYFPQIMNYFIYSLKYDEGTAGLILGGGLVLAIPLTLIAGKFINKGKFAEILTVAVLINIIGLFIITIKGIAGLIIGTVFVGGGYMMVYQTLMVWVKNLYPEDKRAQLEGVRLLFYVCIPMVIGPAIATPIIKNFGYPMVNDYGEAGFSASAALFYIAAAFAVLTFIPIFISKKVSDSINNKK